MVMHMSNFHAHEFKYLILQVVPSLNNNDIMHSRITTIPSR